MVRRGPVGLGAIVFKSDRDEKNLLLDSRFYLFSACFGHFERAAMLEKRLLALSFLAALPDKNGSRG